MEQIPIARHKTAIRRTDLSRPIKCALRDGLIEKSKSVFDYGCGHGQDIDLLRGLGIRCDGWDPAFRPHRPLAQADIVNLGYVINVIENPNERVAALRKAWELSQRLLVVAAQVLDYGNGHNQTEFADGVLTRWGTFQKFYDQTELKAFLESELNTEAVPAALGVFYIFKDQSVRQQFLADRFRRRVALPSVQVSEVLFEQHRQILQPLLEALTAFGRLPEMDELVGAADLIERFGSLKRAFAVIQKVTGADEWSLARRRRTEDLLVYLALSRFRRRPTFSILPVGLQRDIRAFFGSYKRACESADQLLFRAGDPNAIDEACRLSTIGQLVSNGLYVHRSALDSLDPLLRVYEGCAREYLGEIEEANIIKLHRFYPKVSYYACPHFDADPHPVIASRIKLSLRKLHPTVYDYSGDGDPPILLRKDALVTCDYPLYEKFARLTRQEEKHGLLSDLASGDRQSVCIGRLHNAGWQLRGHSLVRSDPIQKE